MAKEYTRRVHVISQIPFPAEPILADNFEGAFEWVGGGSGTDWELTKSADYAVSKNYSMKMITKATTPAVGDLVQARRYPILIPSRYIDLSFAFRPEYGSGTLARIYAIFDITNTLDGKRFRYYMRIDAKAGKLQMETASGVWTDIKTIKPPADGCWNKFRMIVDQKDKKITYFETGNAVIEVNKPAYQVGTPNVYYADLIIGIETRTADRATLYVDDVLIRGTEK